MKYALLALSASLAFTGCATGKVTHTDVASGATNPKAIYVRSYIAESAKFKGNHGHVGEKPIRRSLAPAEYSKALKEQLEKLAPAMVLKEDEEATTGWLVESDLVWVHGGSPALRSIPVISHLGPGRSFAQRGEKGSVERRGEGSRGPEWAGDLRVRPRWRQPGLGPLRQHLCAGPRPGDAVRFQECGRARDDGALGRSAQIRHPLGADDSLILRQQFGGGSGGRDSTE
jgi:hypothetical protein